MTRPRLADRVHPQRALADRLGGEAHQSGAVVFGGNTVSCSPLGKVRVNGVIVGTWDDPTDVLAAAVLGAVAA